MWWNFVIKAAVVASIEDRAPRGSKHVFSKKGWLKWPGCAPWLLFESFISEWGTCHVRKNNTQIPLELKIVKTLQRTMTSRLGTTKNSIPGCLLTGKYQERIHTYLTAKRILPRLGAGTPKSNKTKNLDKQNRLPKHSYSNNDVDPTKSYKGFMISSIRNVNIWVIVEPPLDVRPGERMFVLCEVCYDWGRIQREDGMNF